ncbi:hydroxyacylglutathione hydrolase [Pseudoxanthomonas daejeonensis]|uniref:hydroxyacylglutathione hydrolase n=1 Tax=Pseudoxanthomonas daejeonensis TaxID=266062 RepID=UPI001F544BFE|nr:hydroxyacylglutathione hydrolase [Pseudoxanthomonas daejeonensis]UNK57778.1 hydroxyacylglutathione hydrolase [Pseudoxanthomonas daejeonensis]
MRLSMLPAFEDNYIWVLRDSRRALLVDPGDAAPVLAAAREGLEPAAILLTHHHPDHCGGVPALLERWPGLQVFAPDDERIAVECERVGEGSRLRILDSDVQVMAVPGHTRSHVAYVTDGHLFCGDTLFSLGCGRMFEGTPTQMHDSLRRLASLPGDLQVCCGHEYTQANAAFACEVEPGNPDLAARRAQVLRRRAAGLATLPTTLESERACNPFLRCDVPAVRETVARRLGHAPATPVETFAALRSWKDGFRA